jgi:hypothetical protein
MAPDSGQSLATKGLDLESISRSIFRERIGLGFEQHPEVLRCLSGARERYNDLPPLARLGTKAPPTSAMARVFQASLEGFAQKKHRPLF